MENEVVIKKEKSNNLFIRIYQSKKTGKTYYGTVIDKIFYFVHFKDETKVVIKNDRLNNRQYIIWDKTYDIVNTEQSKDIFIGYRA